MQARKDELTSGKIETALIFEEMLGTHDAAQYLRTEHVPEAIIERILFGGPRRPPMAEVKEAQPEMPNGRFYLSNGRRKDQVRACVVQAALGLRGQLGNDRIAQMLIREKLSEDVIKRVLQGDPGYLRTRPAV